MVVFAVSGIWHGAAWNFLAWGLYHGALVALERRAEPVLSRLPKLGRCVLTFVVVVVGWVLFRARDMKQAGWMLATMFGNRAAADERIMMSAQVFPRVGVVAVVGALAFVALRMVVRARDEQRTLVPPRFFRYPALSVALLAASMMHMANTRYMPLIYFKF